MMGTVPTGETPRQTPEGEPSELAALRREIDALRQIASDPTLQSRMAAIVESSDDAIVSKGLDGVIRTWNKGAERIFGWRSDEVVGKAINIIIPDDRQHEEPEILRRLQRGERVDHFETVRITKDRRLINVSVTISPVRDATGKIVAASKIARDITRQKQVEQELRDAKEMAEQANRSKDQFLSILSHELRTPLTPVLAEMSYLEQLPDLPPPLRQTVAMIRRNVETEARLVDDLLDLTRIARGKIELRYEVVDVNEAVRATIRMVQAEVEQRGIELTVGLRARWHHVWADPGRLQQVILNLLSNAVKFTPEGGTVAVRSANVGEGGTRIRLEISDNGIGIEPAHIARLFNAFEQDERTRRMGGLGLGLSIARSLVELHGGTIRATSDGRDRGATFTVELPVMSNAAATEQAVGSGPKGSAALAGGGDARRLTGFRILLVEDHADTRAAMARLLAALGCSVASAGSVREAMDLAGQQSFDLLISDIGLPDGSGTDVMRGLRERKLRGIALSGYGQEEDVRRSHEAGFDLHMTKPVNFQALRDALARYAPPPHPPA